MHRVRKRLEIKNRLGMHARASALLVQTVNQFAAEVKISKDDNVVNARSIMGVLTLGAAKGAKIRVETKGRTPGSDACHRGTHRGQVPRERLGFSGTQQYPNGRVEQESSMTNKDFVFTSESVSEGHPDKMCDQISDAVLDAHLALDPDSRVACETLVKNDLIVIAGEITSKGRVDYESLARQVALDIGYDHPDKGFDGNNCEIS